MTNKRFLTRGKILLTLVVFLLVTTVTGVLSTRFIGQAHASEHYQGSAYLSDNYLIEADAKVGRSQNMRFVADFMDYSVDEIRTLLNSGVELYNTIRV